MKKSIWGKVTVALAGLVILSVGGVAAAEEEAPSGSPVLPKAALAPIGANVEAPAELRSALKRTEAIVWLEASAAAEPALPTPAPSFEAVIPRESDSTEARPLRAYLVEDPVTTAPAERPAPRDCREVKRERRELKLWIESVGQLRRNIERRLDDYERYLRQGRAESARRAGAEIDAELAKLEALLVKMNDYVTRESEAGVDRIIVYNFRLMGSRGERLLRLGFRPVEEARVAQIRFGEGKWLPVREAGISAFEGFTAAPSAAENGNWTLRRELTAAHACLEDLTFTLRALAPGQRLPEGWLETIHVELYARKRPFFLWD